MIKKFINLTFVVFIISVLTLTNVVLADGVDEYFEEESNEYNILATIQQISDEDSTITLRKGYTICDTSDEVLPDEITVPKFRYSYNSSVADKYNSPQYGDNIIISIKKVNDTYIVQDGVYVVDNTSGNVAKIRYPIEIDDSIDKLKLTALAYYMRTNGERTKFEYTKDKVKTIDGQEINPEEYLEALRFNPDTNKPELINKNDKNTINDESKWIIGAVIISFGMIIGYIVILFINKKIEAKNR